MSQKKKSGFGKLLAGIGIGVGLGMLFAPDKGEITRKKLKKSMEDLLEKIKSIDVEEVKKDIENRIEKIKIELADLDKEKVLKIAKDKSKKLKMEAEKLVEIAKEKASPIIEKSANDIKNKVIEVTKSVLEKLEKGQE